MSDFFDLLALGMSAIGIGVAVWAKRDSKRSADAAEKSAQEAENARKIGQSEFLRPLFEDTNRLYRILSRKESHKNDRDQARACVPSVTSLKHIRASDLELVACLDQLIAAAEDFEKKPNSLFNFNEPYNAPDNFDIPENTIKDKSSQYLNIG